MDISNREAEKVTSDGFEAYGRGIDRRDNPYTANSDRWFCWDQGWHGAKETDTSRALE
jgi:hypothetical protein